MAQESWDHGRGEGYRLRGYLWGQGEELPFTSATLIFEVLCFREGGTPSPKGLFWHDEAFWLVLLSAIQMAMDWASSRVRNEVKVQL